MNFLDSLLAALKKLFFMLLGLLSRPPQPPPTDDPAPLQPLAPRVLLIVYDPLVDPTTGEKLSARMKWKNVADLVAGYIADIDECSGGLIKYRVVERIDRDEFPLKADGFRYAAATYLDVMAKRSPAHDPDLADYPRILSDFNILARVMNDEIDEVWLFAFPFGGFYESHMAGRQAFRCNSPPLANTAQCPRRFVLMGFSYERGVGEMLESFGHRAEFTLKKVYERTNGNANLIARFLRYDQTTPGQAEVGTIHFAPNSDRDYDWGNRRLVASHCDDWLNYPNFNNAVRQVNCEEWGNGDTRGHHTWWLAHLPKVAGRTEGILNNWWTYIADPNTVLV
ncbi:MAG TPA: hypothetical protein VJG32_16615 [Anaerolineae bacterium]|nr:hypothetical protein [Anaerolineae bacterium]